MQFEDSFVHHVHFWLKDKADKAKFIAGLETLKPISFIKHMHIGEPADTHRDVVDRSYDVSLLLLFASAQDEEAYQVDPTHVAFAEGVAKPLCAKVVVSDSIPPTP
ncbi:Dabb family protein [Mucilaginibacter ginkgonis]|uniref:Dabb family protein n=1 Tax=Mucilaginibacter ginkgonis TaxID=2682091 RepID=A0A6I4HVD7_9SPHI|nr:Dabb family protein [Mucilaginibacter ginkgonis]QQL50098.1 Dabb family protein [Mucilaginibacter ginkgonis]